MVFLAFFATSFAQQATSALQPAGNTAPVEQEDASKPPVLSPGTNQPAAAMTLPDTDGQSAGQFYPGQAGDESSPATAVQAKTTGVSSGTDQALPAEPIPYTGPSESTRYNTTDPIK